MTNYGFGDDYLPMLYSDDAGMMIVNEALGENGQGGGNGDPKPSAWQQVKNFFRNIFGSGKNKQADVIPIAGAAALNRPIYIGELEKVGRVLTIEQVTAALGTIWGVGRFAIPLMLNGDSAGAKGYDVPLTGVTDVPADEPEQLITLYRGVSSKAKGSMYFEAMQGIAIPGGFRQISTTWGPHTDMELHAAGDNLSIWTSWTSDINVARDFATGNAFYKNGVHGIIMSKTFTTGQAAPNPFTLGESEWLVPGITYGAKVQYVSPRSK